MTKRLESKYKINRRYGVNLWGCAKSPVNKRAHRPGEHSQRNTGRPSNYSLQLAAKQKLRGYYGNITERQFRGIYIRATNKRGDTGENLLNFLERRLDAVVYRMKLAPTVFASRQIVNHGHILVNGKKVNIPSYSVKDGDEVSVKESSHTLALVLGAQQSSERDIPGYIEVDPKKLTGRFLRQPEHSDIPYPVQMEPHLIIEWYSRRI